MDKTHEQVADLGAVLSLEEQRILAMKNGYPSLPAAQSETNESRELLPALA